MHRTCSIARCPNKATRRNGWCATHYYHWKKYGDPLAGRWHGEVLNHFTEHVMEPSEGCRLWPYSTTVFGYGQVWIDGRRREVPALTCERWYGPKPTPQHEAAHYVCGNPICWAGEHLRWSTSKENAADMVRHGTAVRGVRNPRAKLTEEGVRDIRRRLANGDLGYRIAADYGISTSMVSRIKLGKAWSWLS